MQSVKKLLRNRVLQHLVFWGISLYLLLKNFQSSSQLSPTDLIYTGIVSLYIVFAVYLNLQLLIPRFFQRGKYAIYVVLLVALLLLITWFQMVSFDVLVDRVFPGYYLISYFDFWGTLRYYLIFVGISSLLHFSKSWFLYREAETRLAITQKEKIEAELSALKGQINPHFLFNSLNSIYSLVLNSNKHAPEALIKLSDALRYVIYESDHEKVSLEKEIEFLKNYVELQRLRMSDGEEVNLSVRGQVQQQEIAPLLLLPIIENAFKYGTKGASEQSQIEIDIAIDENQLSLRTKNTIGQIDETGLEVSGGAGLTNLRKRLDLIYPGNHSLTIDSQGNIFKVHLQIGL